MTTLARIAIGLVLALLTSSCAFNVNWGDGTMGNGEIVEESREISQEFTEIRASEGIDVFVTQGRQFSINIEADENIIDLIGTDIEDGSLKIHAIENIGRATKKVFVSLPEITSLKSSSGANLMAKNTIKADKIALDASSGSGIELEVVANEIEADASSGADIKVSGKTEMFYADASSGSDIKAKELKSTKCDANASSGADIAVDVTESLVANASSGADISYSGDAKVTKKKSVSGSVRKR
ncbi:Hypothetical protein I595_3672 [Croceitalea dokdonensis DOKDO 023]|uniref:Putative auto-transporter adhesin head GIN domain-containing protein n=1 Tax=Croceitalea dokdonensis DOKDO 023 TaxID=1300341 RepID=A0A0P7AMH4_9FLAO|nr:head GIN domain-containing protein [Croceitalea dokdonensis]KPM30262.1 Hypothetical protein I595_3672 [Croceitalea dokdonensis DOKDO 023]